MRINPQSSLAEANAHAKIRIGKINAYGSFGVEVFGKGVMMEFSALDRRSDGPFHIISVEGVFQLFWGASFNIYFYIAEWIFAIMRNEGNI